jgi:hypothetical protein
MGYPKQSKEAIEKQEHPAVAILGSSPYRVLAILDSC